MHTHYLNNLTWKVADGLPGVKVLKAPEFRVQVWPAGVHSERRAAFTPWKNPLGLQVPGGYLKGLGSLLATGCSGSPAEYPVAGGGRCPYRMCRWAVSVPGTPSASRINRKKRRNLASLF
jgi:hypothetical protein